MTANRTLEPPAGGARDRLGPVFLTGGSGYLGRNLIRELVARGEKVCGLARSPRSATTVESLGARAVRGDLLDATAIESGAQGCRLLVHAAADVSQRSGGGGEQERINVDGTRAVLRSVRAAGIPRAVHISTEAVLADGHPLVHVDEKTPLPDRHAGPYSATKAAAERAALAENGDGLDVVVVRPRLVWGRDDTTVLPALVDAARTGRLVWIGGGRYLTSTTHVSNAVAGVLAAARHGRPGQVYFLSDGEPVEFRDFVTRLLRAAGTEPPRRSVPRVLVRAAVLTGARLERVSSGRLHGPVSLQEYALMGHEVTVDDALARRELGYRPIVSREDGFAELDPGAGTPHGTPWTWQRHARS